AGLRPHAAVLCIEAVLLSLGLGVYMTIRSNALDRLNLEQPPVVLEQKARETIAQFGYPGRPYDSAFGMDDDRDFRNYVEKNDKPRPDWNKVLAARPSLLVFWYRQGADTLSASHFQDQFLTPGVVDEDDPPQITSGMINIRLDPQGRLTYFQA